MSILTILVPRIRVRSSDSQLGFAKGVQAQVHSDKYVPVCALMTSFEPRDRGSVDNWTPICTPSAVVTELSVRDPWSRSTIQYISIMWFYFASWSDPFLDRVEYIPIATADQLAEPLSLEFERQESKNRLRNSFNGSKSNVHLRFRHSHWQQPRTLCSSFLMAIGVSVTCDYSLLYTALTIQLEIPCSSGIIMTLITATTIGRSCTF